MLIKAVRRFYACRMIVRERRKELQDDRPAANVVQIENKEEAVPEAWLRAPRTIRPA